MSSASFETKRLRSSARVWWLCFSFDTFSISIVGCDNSSIIARVMYWGESFTYRKVRIIVHRPASDAGCQRSAIAAPIMGFLSLIFRLLNCPGLAVTRKLIIISVRIRKHYPTAVTVCPLGSWPLTTSEVHHMINDHHHNHCHHQNQSSSDMYLHWDCSSAVQQFCFWQNLSNR